MKNIISGIIRATLRPALSPKRPIKLQRFCTDAASLIILGPHGYTIQKFPINHISTSLIKTKSANPDVGILYFHGGGYVVGSSKSHSKLAAQIGHQAKAQVWLPEYRLAPEHTCPAAIEDGLTIYQALLSQGKDPKKLVIAGDSAGGGLTLATAIAIRDAGLPLPAALVLLSPWVDLSLSGNSIETHAKQDAMLSPDWLAWCAKQYCGSEASTTPTCSPLFADLSGLPPVLIHIGTEEILLDDAKRLAEHTARHDLQTTFKIFDGVGHVFQFHAGILKESNQSIKEIGTFIQQHTYSL